MGRPRENPPTNAAATIKQLAKEGAEPIVIAEHFGVHVEMLMEWIEADEKLAYAYKVGQALLKKELIDRLRVASQKNQSLDGNAKFLLRSVFGMSEDGESTGSRKAGEEPAPVNVLVVKDFGTDEQWAAKAAEQQRRLTVNASTPLPSQASQLALEATVSAEVVPSPVVPLPPSYKPNPPRPVVAPSWKRKA